MTPSTRVRIQRTLMQIAARIPPAILELVGRRSRVNSAGDRIAVEMAVAGFVAAHVKSFDTTRKSVTEARADLRANAVALAEDLPPMAVEEDLLIDGPGGRLPVTRYRAQVDSTGIVVFFHGGGWVTGDRISHDSLVRRLAIASGADVLSVDYRLAPEHRFPAAVDDAIAAWRYAVNSAPRWGVSPSRIALAGDSAGGNLSAVVAQQVRGEEVTPRLQLLIYPGTDCTTRSESRREFASGFYLTDERIDWFLDHYVPDIEMRSDPRVSPLLAQDLSGLAPAHVVIAGFDPLRDEGIAYAQRLAAAGVPVTLDRAGSLIHGFANMTLISSDARAAVDRMGAALAEALH